MGWGVGDGAVGLGAEVKCGWWVWPIRMTGPPRWGQGGAGEIVVPRPPRVASARTIVRGTARPEAGLFVQESGEGTVAR